MGVAKALTVATGLMLGLAACTGPCSELVPGCFDGPCPGNRVEDNTGCVWDGCAEIIGNKIPCWYMDPQYETASSRNDNWFSLVGDRSQYIAYVREQDDYGYLKFGPLYLYDLESGEHRKISGDGELCMNPKGDGSRIAWIEVTWDEETMQRPTSMLHVLDLDTEQRWEVPGSDGAQVENYDLSGDHAVITELSQYDCGADGPGFETRRDIWLFTLSSGIRSLVAESVLGAYSHGPSRTNGDLVAFWRLGGFCGGEGGHTLWLHDIETGSSRLLDDIGMATIKSSGRYNYNFHFDGKWLVTKDGKTNTLIAYDVETNSRQTISECGFADCQNQFQDGLVVYERSNEDGKIQTQLHIADLRTGERKQLTNLRVALDDLVLTSMKGRRALWSEDRGQLVDDGCGNTRHVDDRTPLWVWMDIEF